MTDDFPTAGDIVSAMFTYFELKDYERMSTLLKLLGAVDPEAAYFTQRILLDVDLNRLQRGEEE